MSGDDGAFKRTAEWGAALLAAAVLMLLHVADLMTVLLDKVFIRPGKEGNGRDAETFQMFDFLVDLYLSASAVSRYVRRLIIIHHF